MAAVCILVWQSLEKFLENYDKVEYYEGAKVDQIIKNLTCPVSWSRRGHWIVQWKHLKTLFIYLFFFVKITQTTHYNQLKKILKRTESSFMSTTAKITKVKDKMKSKVSISDKTCFQCSRFAATHVDCWYIVKQKIHHYIRSYQTFLNYIILIHKFDYQFIEN